MLLPALQAHDWPHRDQVPHRPVFAGETSPWMPVVTVADDTAIPAESDIDRLLVEALPNLVTRPVRHQRIPFEGGVCLGVTGDAYAAERILDRELLRRLSSELESDPFVVGLPYRGMLLAGAPSAGFLTLLSARYHGAPSEPLSPLAFLVADGEIVGLVTGHEDSGAASASADRFAAVEARVLAGLSGAGPGGQAALEWFDALATELRPWRARPDTGGRADELAMGVTASVVQLARAVGVDPAEMTAALETSSLAANPAWVEAFDGLARPGTKLDRPLFREIGSDSGGGAGLLVVGLLAVLAVVAGVVWLVTG